MRIELWKVLVKKKRLIEKLRESYKSTELIYESDCLNNLFKNECRELKEPWMTLDEFLKSGFVGKCWILAENDTVHEARYSNNEFNDVAVSIYYFDHDKIKGVAPIHKPEPPKL